MSLLVPETGLLFWMTLVFAGVFFILAKYGFPVITGAVEKRTKSINDSLEAAKEAEVRLSTFQADAEALISNANAHKDEILTDAQQQRREILEQARVEAEEKVKSRLEHAEAEVSELKQKALSEARDEIVDLSIRIAEKVIGEKLGDDEKQKMLIEQYLKGEVIRKT